MKNKILFLATAFSFFATVSFAQNDRSYNNNYNNSYNDNDDYRTGNNDYNNSDRNQDYNNGYNNGQPEYRSRGRYQDHSAGYAMSPKEFRRAMRAVNDASFDRDKLRMARFIVSRNSLTSSQIGIMASLFSFDDSKLAFSKMAYASCIDPQNYYLVSRVFSFNATRAQLMRYLARV